MALSLTWADLSLNETTTMQEMGRGPGLTRRLADTFKLGSDAKGRTLLEMYANNLAFATEKGFSAEATSAFFSIMKRTFETSMEQIMAVDKSYDLFKDTLLRHSVQRPPYSVGIFSLAEIKAINDYVVNGFFRHYKLYRHVFTREQRHTVETQKWLGGLVEYAPVPPPLCEAEEQLAEQPVELAEDAVQEIVDQTGEDPLTVKEAFASAVKQELRGLQESLRAQEASMNTMAAELEAKIKERTPEQADDA